MALTPEQARELQQMLLEIEKLSGALKKNIDTTSLQDLEKSAGAIKQLFKSLKKEWEEINEDISFAVSGFQKIVQEISNVNVGLKESNKAYTNLTSIASKIQSYQQGLSELSSKEIKNLKEKAKIEKQRIENAQELLKEKKKEQESDLERLKNSKELKEIEIKRLENLNSRTKEQNDLLNETRKQLKGLTSEFDNSEKALKKTTDILRQNQAILENQDELYKGLISVIDDETKKAKNLEKALGLSGAAVTGIGNAFKKAGLGSLVNQMGLDEAQEKMKIVAFRITQGGTNAAGLIGKFRILGAGIASLGKSIMKNLTDPLVLAGLAAKAVSAGIGLIKKGVGLLSKGFGSVVGFVKNLWGMADSFAAIFEKYAKAGQFAAQNFSAIGAQVGKITAGLNAAAAADPFMRVAEAGPAFKAIVDGTGIMQTQMTKSVKEAHDLSYWLGYSAEETGQLYKLGQLNNQTATDTVTQIKARGTLLNKEHKISLDLRKVEQAALKASAAVKYNLSQNPKALADAAFYATKLNMTLDEIASASEATLNFEQSIQDQLAYQAMSGKELNLDAYQQAALRGDSATAAKELNNLIAEHGSELKGNVLLQDQFAKSIGIGKDKLLEALATQELAAKMGEDRVDIEKGLQFYMSKGLTREEAANKLAKEGLATQLAQSKRAEAMSRALEDFRDYMATRLWPLFKAVFSPANIKMFMAAINGMRPVFVELGKAITAFFSPKSAGTMADVIKNDVMPAILGVAKIVTKISGIFGESLFKILKDNIVPLVKDKLVPLVDKVGALLVEFAPEIGKAAETVGGGIIDTIGMVIDTIMDNKDEIKAWLVGFSDTLKGVLSFAKDNIGGITAGILALKGFNLMKSAGVFEFAKNVKNVVMGSPGSERNPLYVRSADGGMGGGGGGKWSDKSLGGKIQSTVATGAKIAAIGAAGYTAFGALTAKKEEDITQEDVAAYRAQKPSAYSEEISSLEAKGTGRTEDETKKLAELKAKSDKEAREEIVSSQFQTGSKTGDLMLAGTEAVAGLAINTGGGMGALFGGAKNMLGFGKKGAKQKQEAPTSEGAPDSGGASSPGGIIDTLTKASSSLPEMLGNLGKSIGSFFSGLSTGLVTFGEAMAAPTPLFGLPVGLIVVGMAMGLAKAAQISAPAIAALGPMFEGLSTVVAALAPPIEAAGKAIESVFGGIGTIIKSTGEAISGVITSIADSIVKLENLDGGKLLSVAGGLTALSAALAAYGGGGLLAGVGNAVGEFFGGDPVEKFNKFTQIESDKIVTLADAITKLSASFVVLNGTMANMKSIDPLTKITDEIIRLHDELSEDPIDQMVNTVTSGVSSLYNKANDFVKSIFQDGAVQVKDGVIQVQDSSLNPNGGLVVSKYQKGQLQPVAQGIKEDNVYFTTNKLSSGGSGGQGAVAQNNNAAVVAALDRLTNMMANSSKTVELNIDGKKVGYAVTPTVLDTAKKTSVNIS